MPATEPSRLMTMTEIAQAAGVPVATVSSWKRRSPETFPPEIRDPSLGKRARYERSAVEEWLKTVATQNRDNKTDHRRFLRIASLLRGQLDPLDTLDLIGALLVALKAHPDALDGLNGIDGHHIERLLHEPGPVPFDFQDPYARVDPDTYVRLAWELRDIDDPADFLAEAIDQTNNRLLGKLPQTTTPETIAEFLMALSPDGGSLAFDPAAGTARLLRTAILGGKVARAAGIEIDIRALLTARRIAYLSDIDIDIQFGNALRSPGDADLKADLVLCDAPLGMKWDPDAHPRDWAFGQPSTSSFDLGWVQLGLEHLAPGGRAIIVTAPGAAWRKGRDAAIRSALVRQGAVQAVIALPGRLRMDTGLPLTVWVLGTPGRPRPEVLLVDASRRDRADLQPLAELIRAWLDGENPELDAAEAAPVSTVELLTPEVDLNPARWVQIPGEDRTPEDWQNETEGALRRAQDALKTVGATIGNVRVRPTADAQMLTIAELMKSRRLEVHRGRVWEQVIDGDGPRILTPRVVREGEIDGAEQGVRRTFDDAKARREVIRPGDIIVFSTANAVEAQVWDHDGWVAGSLMQVLHLLDPDIDPHYLAAALRHPRNQALLTGSAVRAQFRIEDFTAPLPPPADQHAYQRLEHDLDERIAQLHAAAEKIHDARDVIAAAATSGIVTVESRAGD